MSHKIALSVSLIASLFVSGCGSDHHQADHRSDEVQEADRSDHEAHEHGLDSGELGLVLNDGKKWSMDEHTRTMFTQMAGRLESDAEGRELGELLKGDLDELIAGCTMTGDAHNQLHVFLATFMPTVHSLSESGDSHHQAKIEELLRIYPEYFE